MSLVDVVCIGEILVDVIPVEVGDYREGMALEVHFGGAPANVAVGVARLGHRSGFVGAIGNDPLGYMLRKFLEVEGVNTRWLVTKSARTSLAFVVLREYGERDFFFYREPWVKTADTMLSPDDVGINEVVKAKVVHVSGVAFAYPPLSETVYDVMRRAFEEGVNVSTDPNYRQDIWSSGENALKAMDRYFKVSTIITMGIEELDNMFRTRNYRFVAGKLMEKYRNIEVVAIRLGAQGAYVKTKRYEVYKQALKINPVDTTGAGDTWSAAFIVFYVIEGKDLEKAVWYSNIAAGLKCLRRGAVTAIPKRVELEEYLEINKLK
ncbi:MAG: sugar kinase [Ignisphaera sp.]|uniref:Sugar kinase n=1 Tax=Ignisphaera aggregans TaxID=334771 RepID=A0A7C4NQR9_9CREN